MAPTEPESSETFGTRYIVESVRPSTFSHADSRVWGFTRSWPALDISSQGYKNPLAVDNCCRSRKRTKGAFGRK